jgi:hypothetical protein
MFLNQVSVLMTSGVIANASTPQENQKVEYQLALLRLAVHTMCPNLPPDKVAATAALFYGPAALPGVEDLQFYLANNQSFTQMEKALEAQFDAASKTLADVEQEPFVSPQIILTNLRQLEDIKNDLSSPSVQNRSPN